MKKVAIVGKAATATLAPYDDPEWDIWGLAWKNYPRVDLQFDVHHPDFKKAAEFKRHFNSHHNPDGLYLAKVNGEKVPIMCHPSAMGSFERGRPFPFEEVKAILPRVYLDCSISWMIGYAMLIGVEHIGLWGCHFMRKEEYAVQLPSVAYMIGLAEGRGVKVDVCAGAPMLMSGYVAGAYGISPEFRFWKGV